MRFIDLFAGLGGFHVALDKLGHQCVFASELDNTLADLYESNFGISVHGDIRGIDEVTIPQHDILCAGFPCQPFSKAGFQEGLKDLKRGGLFNEIARILRYHQPNYFILENVPNLRNHNNGKTWEYIQEILEDDLGYVIDHKKLSPHQFGIPQIRERVFIVGSKMGLNNFTWPQPKCHKGLSINTILDETPKNHKTLPEKEKESLRIWQEFLNSIPADEKLPSFPIWAMEFGASYPFQDKTPHASPSNVLGNCLGQFGESLYGMSKCEQMQRIPKYARQKTSHFPEWKRSFILQNREFYKKYKNAIDPLLPDIKKMVPSWQKFEWNCQGEERIIKNLIIQFRASGIRVKRSNYSPSLVSSTSTQVPIIGWEDRYMTVAEAARLQSLHSLQMPNVESIAFRALGNAVNASVVELIAQNLLIETEKSTERLLVESTYSSNFHITPSVLVSA